MLRVQISSSLKSIYRSENISQPEIVFQRYMECYIDDRDQDICLFDPVLCIAKMEDKIHQFNKKLFVCNREPYCDCQKEDVCICDDDDYSPVKVDLHIGSGCKCNLNVTVQDQLYVLRKNFMWRIFGLDDDTEIPLIDIDPIDSKINLLPEAVCFTSDDNISYNTKSKTVNVQVNYMHFEKESKDPPRVP